MPINSYDEIIGGRPLVSVTPEETAEERRASRHRAPPPPMPLPRAEKPVKPGNQRQEMPLTSMEEAQYLTRFPTRPFTGDIT